MSPAMCTLRNKEAARKSKDGTNWDQVHPTLCPITPLWVEFAWYLLVTGQARERGIALRNWLDLYPTFWASRP